MNCSVRLLCFCRNVCLARTISFFFLSQHGLLYFRRAILPTGHNSQLYCARFDLPLSRLTSINNNSIWRNVVLQLDAHCSTVSGIRDMLCEKSKQVETVDVASYDVNYLLESVCLLTVGVLPSFSFLFFNPFSADIGRGQH